MLIEGKHVSLETSDPVKGQAIVNYVDWIYENNKEEIMKEAMELYFNGEYRLGYDGTPNPLVLK